MIVEPLSISDVLLIKPSLYDDHRGSFYEFFNQKEFNTKTDLDINFVQDNISYSKQGVLRGLHYQVSPMQQGKLVGVLNGEVIDVVVDIRKNSKTYGKYIKEIISSKNKKQLWIPPGFAHGFYTLSENTIFFYKTTNFYSKEHEKTLVWNDASLNIDWGIVGKPITSKKDTSGQPIYGNDIL